MLQWELPILGQPPCFQGYENLQLRYCKRWCRSGFLHMKLGGFRPFFSRLLLTVIVASVVATAQTSPPPASQNSNSPTAQNTTPSSPPSSTPAADDKSANAAGQSGKPTDASTQGQSGNQQGDPLKRPLTEKQKKANSKALKQELSSTYKKWLNEDVRWIITPEELSAFKQLSNDEERDAFIEQFWLRRDPTPDTPENEYKEEHYRRIAYANEHFASGIPGWRTDRGRIYIIWGKPDEIEAHPSGGTYDRPQDEGGGTTTTYPWETWRYRYLEGIQENVVLEFVDPTGTGEYHLTMDPSEKDALTNVPNAGLSDLESMGMASKADRF